MGTPKTYLTDPEAIVREFQKRQKNIAVAAIICIGVMIPVVMWARSVHPFLAVAILFAFILPLITFYFWTFRCPACGTRVQQRRRMLREPIRCGQCGVLLDTH